MSLKPTINNPSPIEFKKEIEILEEQLLVNIIVIIYHSKQNQLITLTKLLIILIY
jgi:hypothetical protein